MAVRAISEYKFPSLSRQELYGDDELVHVWWKGNPYFVSASCFRFPKAMPFGDLVGVLKGFYTADPDFVPDSLDSVQWVIDDRQVTPDMAASLESNGVGHKSLIQFSI
jgi:phenol/toluene 2-monooxygenase (NADH) P4/A4